MAGRKRRAMKKMVKRNAYQTICLGSVMLGVAFGMFLKLKLLVEEHHYEYISFPADLMVKMLRTISIPLVVTSVAIGVSSLSRAASKKIGLRMAVYSVMTNVLAAILGVILSLWLKPGNIYNEISGETAQTAIPAVVFIGDLIKNCIPRNVILTAITTHKSYVVDTPDSTGESRQTLVEAEVEGTNVIGLIFMSMIAGFFLDEDTDAGRTALDGIFAINYGTKHIINMILYYLPFGLFFMIATTLKEVPTAETFEKLAIYLAITLMGLLLHGVVTLPTVCFLWSRHNAFTVIRAIQPALITAITISSSAAALPQAFRCCERRLKIDTRITRFLLPIMASINMNGTTLYEVTAALFITQLHAIELKVTQIVMITLMSIMSSFGTAAAPTVGGVSTMVILSVCGLPVNDVSLLVSINWLIDRFVTVVNLGSNCIGVSLIAVLSEKELQDPNLDFTCFTEHEWGHTWSDDDSKDSDSYHSLSEEYDFV